MTEVQKSANKKKEREKETARWAKKKAVKEAHEWFVNAKTVLQQGIEDIEKYHRNFSIATEGMYVKPDSLNQIQFAMNILEALQFDFDTAAWTAIQVAKHVD